MHFTPDGRNRAHREYCNVAYSEAMEEEWRDEVPSGSFSHSACAKTWDLPSEDWTPLPINETGS